MGSRCTADELAEDSEDEKRLEKAEKAAERKAFKRKRTKTMPSRPRLCTANLERSVGGAQPVVQRRMAVMLGQQPTRLLGPCFACGEMGHFRHWCPHTAGVQLQLITGSGILPHVVHVTSIRVSQWECRWQLIHP